MSKLIATLTQRGMIHNIVPGTAAQLAKEQTAAYIGFDPTAASLHVGNLAAIMLLKQLQAHGHRPVIVLGGATGMIGDPAGKTDERKLLARDTLHAHQEAIKKQMSDLLDFKGSNSAIMVNNYDWFKNMDLLSFLRDVGKHISVNYMMGKDSVKNRLVTGISYTEFAYQLLQAYDFYHLYTTHGVKMQMGGSDQWGNLTTGVALIRKKTGKQAYALTTPLMLKADGSKFGKSEQGNVWLDPKMTSPYAFYQFLLNTTDEEAKILIKRMTLYSKEEIEGIITEHERAPHERGLQRALAKFLTTFVHTQHDYLQAMKASEILFGNAPASAIYTLAPSYLLQCLEGVPHITIREPIDDRADIVTFLTATTQYNIFASKREAREVVQAGGIRINKQKVTRETRLPTLQWIGDQYILVQKGKKKFYVVARV